MKKIIFTILALTITILAQESKLQLSGNLSEDLLISSKDFVIDENDKSVVIKKRPPILAAGLSVIIPGAGQFYNDDYWKSAIFVAVEVAAIITAISYNTKGNDQTVKFEAFANSENGWDVDKYAHWSVDNASRINPQILEGDPILNIFDSNGNVIWSKLNSLETKIGSWYSHQLAPYDDQQYYEMIGKYQQFNPGWADFNYSDAYTYGDPLTKTFDWYADERGKANSYYDVSNLAVKILVANHIISAVEAAFSANRHNRSLNAEVKMKSNLVGYNQVFYPELSLSYRF
ncbi:MAG: hypothetical protein COW71_12000 [Ignavibacteriales bacterium CG18_big_fil_WC_8_21_14_2_50_31_20]|nr:MAG: hypothetical protein COW71_12000 [Ignavibacteriales bacterium CG18_big_fil_WC_8_21_14_2_50_31_20]